MSIIWIKSSEWALLQNFVAVLTYQLRNLDLATNLKLLLATSLRLLRNHPCPCI